MASYPGTFNDGRTAARQGVTVTPEARGLRIADQDGRAVALWPYEDLRLVDEVFGARPVRLKRGDDDGARLTVFDHRILADLASRSPGWAERGRSRIRGPGLVVVGLAGIALFVGIVWIVLPQLARLTAAAIPVSWEEALGEQAMAETLEIFAFLEDHKPRFCQEPAGRAALDRLVARLAAVTDSPYRFRVEVLDLEVTNAFALPGGRIVFFRGLIEAAEAPEEVAGVLAHEMGHVVHRHGTQAILRSLGLEVLFDVLLGDLGDGVIGSIGETLLHLSYSREAEADADAAALALLDRAAIRPDGLARFFQRMIETDGAPAGPLQILSTHPSPAARARLFAGAAGEGGPAMAVEDWRALRDICAG